MRERRRRGYVAVGAAGSGPDEAHTATVPPKGEAVLVPLDGAEPSGDSEGKTPAEKPGRRASASCPPSRAAAARELPTAVRVAAGGTGSPGGTGGASGGPGSTGGSGGSEKVKVEFRNTGGSPVTSGTVTFATHIIGARGIDWATIEGAQPLPTPIAAGTVRKQAYTVCVDAWRVPMGHAYRDPERHRRM